MLQQYNISLIALPQVLVEYEAQYPPSQADHRYQIPKNKLLLCTVQVYALLHMILTEPEYSSCAKFLLSVVLNDPQQ
jgi:hypothetical protein